ncbi:MAG: carboxymuconolactone decarboxylase family protein [Xanthobacteraceae bacterium]|nr:carboxymuconolactone decarboxylase family protein [Xanthobacteraceae bacterium]
MPAKNMPAKKKPARTTSKKKPAAKMGPVRLPAIAEDRLTPEQRSLMSAIASGPRGTFKMSGPFFCYLHAPAFGELAQKLGAYCRFGTSIAPRLTEFAILTTAQLWKAHYEWAAHEPQALKAGVKPATIQALRAGREPTSAPKDERALYAFIKQLYATGRASDRTYKAAHAVVGDAGMVELVGLLGYYAMVAMTLNVFRMPVAEGTPLPFKEPVVR